MYNLQLTAEEVEERLQRVQKLSADAAVHSASYESAKELIRVDLGYVIEDGSEIKFKSPVDGARTTGLIVYYPDPNIADAAISTEFAFADAHGNNVGDVDHLFAKNAVVKVILDLDTNNAFVQNADTNKYLEERFSDINNTIQELPEHTWESLPDKPFGEETSIITLIDNHTYNFEMNENGDTYIDTTVISDNVIPFETGKSYHVVYKDNSGNIEFDGIVEGYDNSLNLYSILMGLTVYSYEDSYQIRIPGIFGYPEGTITIEYVESNLTQLDSKFIGDDIARVEDIPDGIYVQDEAPTGIEEGALWLDTDEDGQGGSSNSGGGALVGDIAAELDKKVDKDTLANLLIKILRAGNYSTSQTANINALEAALLGSGGGDDSGDAQNNIIQNADNLEIYGGVSVVQNGSALEIS